MYRYLIPCIVESVQGRLGDDVGYVVNGRQRWRSYVKPADPRTKGQLCRRRHFARLVSRWHAMDEAGRDRWNERARFSGKKRFRGFNLFLSTGMREFEALQIVRALRASAKSSRQRSVKIKARGFYGREGVPVIFDKNSIPFVLPYQRE